MKTLMTILAIAALGLTIIPSILVFTGSMESNMQKHLMAAGTILWFVTAPIWFRKKG